MKSERIIFHVISFLLAAMLLGGCAMTRQGDMEEAVVQAPYVAGDFRDLTIPAELAWERDDSMVMRTSSFAGGTLKFSGNVEPDYVSSYFYKSMPENGWKLIGSVNYKNIMLVFTKPHKSCIISIFETFQDTVVYINIADDIAASGGGSL